MKITLAFDVYGTLMNTHGVVSLLEGFIGTKAKIFSQTWRDKQLEYSFRKALMNQYEDFSICTKQALDFTCLFYEIELTEDQKTKLLNFYKSLPLFEDAKEGLDKLTDSNVDLYAFSNGKSESIEFAFSITRKFGGKCFFASHPEYNSNIRLKPFDLISGKNIFGSWGGSSDPQKIANTMAPFFLKNRKFLDLYFSKEYDLSNINQAILDFKSKSEVKLIINN